MKNMTIITLGVTLHWARSCIYNNDKISSIIKHSGTEFLYNLPCIYLCNGFIVCASFTNNPGESYELLLLSPSWSPRSYCLSSSPPCWHSGRPRCKGLLNDKNDGANYSRKDVIMNTVKLINLQQGAIKHQTHTIAVCRY